jgi:hypothetical protein
LEVLRFAGRLGGSNFGGSDEGVEEGRFADVWLAIV